MSAYDPNDHCPSCAKGDHGTLEVNDNGLEYCTCCRVITKPSHDETAGLFVPRERDAIYVVAWDYYENANRDEGGGGGQEWNRDLDLAKETFEWAQRGWGEHPITIRLIRMLAPSGSLWTQDKDVITEAVSAAVDLIEDPSKYPPSFTLLAECKWNGGAS